MGIETAPGMWPAAYSGGGADVEHDDLAGSGPAHELAAVDLFGVVVAQIVPPCCLDVGQVGRSNVAQLRVEHGDGGVGEPVADRCALPGGGDEPRLLEGLQMRRGRRQAQTGGHGEIGNAAGSLGQQIDQLEALAVAQRLADPGQLLEQLGLAHRIAHSILQSSMEECIACGRGVPAFPDNGGRHGPRHAGIVGRRRAREFLLRG
jgi:hypothetical protein